MRVSGTKLSAISSGGGLGNQLWDLAGNRPSLDIPFSETKSLVDTTTGQNLINFTRASSGTYVDSQGVIRTATTNLLLRSEEFDNASWAKQNITATSNQTTAPDGSANADLIAGNAGSAVKYIYQGYAVSTSGSFTFSVFAKAGTESFIVVRINDQGGVNEVRQRFDLSSGTLNGSIAINGTATAGSSAINSAGNGWYRCVVTATFAAFTQLQGNVWLNSYANTSLTTNFYLWGAQLEESSTVGEYIPTTSTINSAPRFDHNPTTGESLGLLVEESRTNLSLQSDNLSDVYWAKVDCTITSNESTAPDGTLTADLWTNIPTAGGAVNNSIAKDANIRTYTASMWVNGTTSLFTMTLDFGGTTNRGRVQYNLATNTIVGTTNTGNFTGTSGTITPYANGWARLTLTTTTSTGTTIRFRSFFGTGGESVYVWGAQVEEGAFPTSYIPTTTATVTRSADVASITGSNFGISRTNLLVRSEEFDNAIWTKVNTTVSLNAATAPDNTTTADKLITDNGIVSTSAHIRQTVSKAATATTYTLTVFAKTGDTGTGTLQLVATDAATTANSATSSFSTVSGTITVAASSQGTFTNVSSTITPFDNGWYRCSLTFTSGTETSIQLRLFSRLPTTGDGTRGLLIWGSQLETGSAATTYIPTTSAAVTVVDSSWYRQDEGTVFSEYFPNAVAPATSGQMLFHISNNSSTDRNYLAKRANADQSTRWASNKTGATDVSFINAGTWLAANSKIAAAYKVNDYAASLNGATSVTDTTVDLFTAMTQINIGSDHAGATPLNGTIKRLTYFPTRLPNSTLQQITQ